MHTPRRRVSTLVRALSLGAILGLGGGLVGGGGGCKPDTAEVYNEELADAICKVRRSCPDLALTSMTGTVTFPDDATCETEVLAQFEGCGTSCKFRRGKARQCLRRLDRLADSCEGPSLGPCRRAYKNCESAEENSRCNLHNCSARIDAPLSEGIPMLALLLAGVWARRRFD